MSSSRSAGDWERVVKRDHRSGKVGLPPPVSIRLFAAREMKERGQAHLPRPVILFTFSDCKLEAVYHVHFGSLPVLSRDDGHCFSTTHLSHSGLRALQICLPWKISRCEKSIQSFFGTSSIKSRS